MNWQPRLCMARTHDNLDVTQNPWKSTRRASTDMLCKGRTLQTSSLSSSAALLLEKCFYWDCPPLLPMVSFLAGVQRQTSIGLCNIPSRNFQVGKYCGWEAVQETGSVCTGLSLDRVKCSGGAGLQLGHVCKDKVQKQDVGENSGCHCMDSHNVGLQGGAVWNSLTQTMSYTGSVKHLQFSKGWLEAEWHDFILLIKWVLDKCWLLAISWQF